MGKSKEALAVLQLYLAKLGVNEKLREELSDILCRLESVSPSYSYEVKGGKSSPDDVFISNLDRVGVLKKTIGLNNELIFAVQKVFRKMKRREVNIILAYASGDSLVDMADEFGLPVYVLRSLVHKLLDRFFSYFIDI